MFRAKQRNDWDHTTHVTNMVLGIVNSFGENTLEEFKNPYRDDIEDTDTAEANAKAQAFQDSINRTALLSPSQQEKAIESIVDRFANG